MTLRTDTRSKCAALGVLAMLFPAPAIADALQTYLALGDSIAFGQTDVIPVSVGDQGYVALYADFLATQNAGIRPNVVNLAFPGETSTGFFTGVSPLGLPPHEVLDSFNLNYQADPTQSQNSLMLSKIASEAAAGRVISHISFALGVNDLIPFELQHPDFFTLPPDQQQALTNEFAGTLTANYVAALSEIRAALPHAELLLLNYYNPAAIFGPTDLFNIINEIFDSGQTTLINSLAGPFGARVVDIHTPFQGHESEFTFVLSGGIHPNDKGYAVIADQMVAATVAEPNTLSLVASAIVAILVCQFLQWYAAGRATNARRSSRPPLARPSPVQFSNPRMIEVPRADGFCRPRSVIAGSSAAPVFSHGTVRKSAGRSTVFVNTIAIIKLPY
jgi:lysophospholipase L1-like esterase